jgi:excisionase family DNA binding protein
MAKDIEVYTLKEIEDLLHVTRRTLYNWIKAGKLKAFRIGKEWRVTKEALEEFTQTGTADQ